MRVIRPLLASVLMVGLTAHGAAALPASPVTPSVQMPAVVSPECTIIGTPGDDLLVGTPGADVVCGLGGNDVISGGDGDDVLRGGSGSDQLRGQAGDDALAGGGGGDVLEGGAGDDVQQGLKGSDLLLGGKGRDSLKGGDGSDDAAGGPGRDTVIGGASWDDLDGGPGSDRLEGGAGADRLDARDDGAFVDMVDCGTSALDRARANVEDRVEFSCEKYPDNVAPTDLTLSNATLSDGQAAGTEVGALNAVDRNPGDRLTFGLVQGAGGQDNAAFSIDGRRLLTNEPAAAATKQSYSIRVRVTDHWGARETKVFTISVDGTGKPPVNPDVPPTAVDDAATVTEDDAATAVDVLANDINADGGKLAVDSVTQPANGTVGITGQGTGLTYRPVADYCNDGSPKDTFTYTLNGGSTATVSVTVTCVVDPAVAKDDAATVTEDDVATAVDVLANDDAGDTGPLSIDSVTQPGDGTVVITGGGTGLTYLPDADYCNDGSPKDSFDYTVSGGSAATVDMTVTCEDDLPSAVDDAASVTEDDPATAVDVLANDTDPDAGPRAVDAVTQPDNGTVVITGGGTGVTYRPDADYCNDGSPKDTFTYTLNGGSTATVAMTVTCVDDPPTAVDDAVTLTEDDGATAVNVLTNDTDPDGGPLFIDSVTQPDNGSVVITGGGTGLTYQPAADYCNSASAKDTFTYTLNGGSEATVSASVNCADDPATAVDDAATVAEDAAATAVDVLANDLNADGGPLVVESVTQPVNGTVVITGSGTGVTYKPAADYCNGGSPKDTFTYTLNGGSTATVSMTVTCVDDPPTAVNDAATVAEDAAATAVNVLANDLNADGGPLSVESVTQPADGTVIITGGGTGLTYQPDADYCNGGSPKDEFTYTLNGGSSATVSITVTCQNDPPIAVDDSGTTDEDTTLTVSAAGVLTNDTDKDPGDTKTVVKLNGSTTLTGTSAEGAVVTIAANGGYSYNPGDKFQGLSTGESDTDSFTYTMADGTGAESTATVDLTITGVSDAPTANTDTFDVVGNTGLFVGVNRPTGQAGRVTVGSLLANDTDPDTPADELEVQAVTDEPTTRGGRITITADGTFAYVPPAGDTAVTDSFTYRVCDASPCTASTVANSTGTLNLPIAGQVWYVDNTAAVGGPGTSAKPFDTLTEAETASGVGDTTFVFDGDDTSTGLVGGYTMNGSERLIGEVSGLTVDPDGAGPLAPSALYPATAGKRPVLTASGEDVVALASQATVTGLGIDPSGSGGGLSGGSGVNALTISDVVINDTGTAGSQPGLKLNGTTGTTNISDLTVSTDGAKGVELTNAGTVVFASTGTVAIVSRGAAGLDVSNTALTGSEFDAITVTGSGNGGVILAGVTGPTAFRDLALTTTSGAAPAFSLTNAGSVTVPAAGSATVSAKGGPAVNVTGSAGASLAFDSVSSEISAGDGINLADLGTGTFSASSGAITGAAGIAFDLDTGSGTVDYAGSIGNGSGASVEITGRTGGVVTLSGRIADSNDGGGGVTLTGNSGATITMSGAVELSTGASKAFTATGGGTVNVTNSDNTLATTSGTALEVVNTTIGASGLTFDSISTNGASKGIVLDTTGSAGGLTVTGTGGTCTVGDTSGCSGGSIVNTTGGDDSSSSPVGTGIVLKNTKAPSLTRMLIQNHSNYAIRGTDVAGFTLANSVVSGTNGTNGATPFDDSAIRFDNLTGSAAITDTHISGGREDNLSVTNATGSLDRLTLTRVNMGLNSATEGNDSIHLESTAAAAALKATIQNSQLTGARGDLIDYSHNGTGAGDLVISNSTFSNNQSEIVTGGGGLTLSSSGESGSTTMDISNNTFRNAVGTAVLVVKTKGPSTQTGTFSSNVIGVTGVANSGSAEGSGLKLQTLGLGTMTWAVTNNQIRGYNENGIEVLAGGGDTATAGTINTTITGNTIAQPGDTAGKADFPKNGIHFNVGTVPGDSFTACAAIGGAGGLANAISSSGKEGLGSPGSDYDFRLRQRMATKINLPGYGGVTNDNSAVVSFIAGRNQPDGTPFGQALNSVPTGGGFTGTGGTCP